MAELGGSIWFRPTRLMQFVGCQHSTLLDLEHHRGLGPEPEEPDAESEILKQKGREHEAAYLKRLEKEEGKTVIWIPPGPIPVAFEDTKKAMRDGAEIIYQGALADGLWGGFADFLERMPGKSDLGSWHYRVADTKLKQRVAPKHVLQIVVYSELLRPIQGFVPDLGHVLLGNDERAPIRIRDFAAYTRYAQRRLELFAQETWPTHPQPCPDCNTCHWSECCEDTWREDDSLYMVANIMRSQVRKLETAGIKTMAELARLDHRISDLAEPTRLKIAAQARLQNDRKTGEPTYELRPLEPGKGFYLMPRPDPGDVYYDIEGDPHYEGGLEYLHGLWYDNRFQAIWSHDHEAEKRGLEELMAFFEKRLAEHPNAHIYHYAPYETTALKRLTGKYGVGEVQLDRWLRKGVFVDLYSVVKGGLICSEKNYSIKSLEVFYDRKRDGEVKTAGGSVVAYENWRVSQEQSILDAICEYNEVDCVSTEELRDWLKGIRPDIPWRERNEEADAQAEKTEAKQAAQEAEVRARADRVTWLPKGSELLYSLGLFYRREMKPAWWTYFASIDMDDVELMEDLDSLAGLEATGPATPVKRSLQRTYQYPPQKTKLRTGKKVRGRHEGGVRDLEIKHLDPDERLVTFTLGVQNADFLADRMNLHPGKPVDTDKLYTALLEVMASLADGAAESAAHDLLRRGCPRIEGHVDGPIVRPDHLVEDTVSAVRRMRSTVLPIQGPPGTGKTYVSAKAIIGLLEANPDVRVAVMGPSHAAIANLLKGCKAEMLRRDLASLGRIVHMGCDDRLYGPDETFILHGPKNGDPEALDPEFRIVGATKFCLAREDLGGAFGWLFIDEAGQVSLADALAVSRTAQNLVLVGDPQQLPQVVQGSHPHPANLSCLEWVVDGHATIPGERGIFLPESRRMHPDVCRFISNQVYEGRLESHTDTRAQRITGTSLLEAGAIWMPVAHQGCDQSSPEEVSEIVATAELLLQGTWTDKDGSQRPMTEEDILVVAPFNAQVIALEQGLKNAGLPGIAVGTVDRFQGQEAAACLVSMTASTVDDSPRGMEFLLSLNRLNVAISRAKALALVFGSPRLLEARCETVEQMRLANTLCALYEHSKGLTSALPWSGTRIIGAPPAEAEPLA